MEKPWLELMLTVPLSKLMLLMAATAGMSSSPVYIKLSVPLPLSVSLPLDTMTPPTSLLPLNSTKADVETSLKIMEPTTAPLSFRVLLPSS